MPQVKKNQFPLVSICIANYNKAPYIKQCLDSILSVETYLNKEIVIVDDCSTDDSISVIKDWIQTYGDKVSVILKVNTKNSGPGHTYNQAVKFSSGVYITFMDSDDFFIKATLEDKEAMFRKTPDLKLVYGNGVFFENGIFSDTTIHYGIEKLFDSYSYRPQSILQNIYCKVPLLSLSTMLIKKDFLLQTGCFDEKILSNDWILNIKIFQKLHTSSEFSIHTIPAFAYRIYDNNISKNYDKVLVLLSQVIQNYCPKDLQKIGYSNIYFTNALSNLSIGKYRKSFSSFFSSVKYRFDFKKIIIFFLAVLVPQRILNLLPTKRLNTIKSIILRFFQ